MCPDCYLFNLKSVEGNADELLTYPDLTFSVENVIGQIIPGVYICFIGIRYMKLFIKTIKMISYNTNDQ